MTDAPDTFQRIGDLNLFAMQHGAHDMKSLEFPEPHSAERAKSVPPPTRAQLGRRFRAHTEVALFDESHVTSEGLAIYTLSDPRDLREVRYVGQTRSPRRRLLQHLNHAQLWLPDERPWWIRQPKLRPLYNWVRELYRDELRLPVMVVICWVPTVAKARMAERERIFYYLAERQPLLNVEMEIAGRQTPLL